VRAPASLSAYPDAAQVEQTLGRLGARMRGKVEGVVAGEDTVRFTLRSQGALDERLLEYIERSDLFGPARVLAREEGGLVLEAPIERRRFLFGTDANGRDLLTRTLIAGRVSLLIGLLATLVALTIGVAYGAIAGYLGGHADQLMMRLVDILYALPFIFFVILLVVFFGRNFVLMFIAVGAIEWLDMARIVRGQTLSLRRQEFVQAAEALGVGALGVVRRHVVPNLLGPVIVYATLLVPKVILLESFLSFLGLGVQEPMTSWGVLIAEGARNIQGATWMLAFPALFLVATLFALSFLGDGLRDATDPKDR
jgi:oligopeptide transport system permease protein